MSCVPSLEEEDEDDEELDEEEEEADEAEVDECLPTGMEGCWSSSMASLLAWMEASALSIMAAQRSCMSLGSSSVSIARGYVSSSGSVASSAMEEDDRLSGRSVFLASGSGVDCALGVAA